MICIYRFKCKDGSYECLSAVHWKRKCGAFHVLRCIAAGFVVDVKHAVRIRLYRLKRRLSRR
ncbi:MAG: hypothetical protein AB1553_00425 [Nitrospirota bacterium]